MLVKMNEESGAMKFYRCACGQSHNVKRLIIRGSGFAVYAVVCDGQRKLVPASEVT
jgi:hypothetical protein